MAKTGGGKTFMAQQFLLMAARSSPRISIIERGSSYQSLVELMEGRVIEMNLEASETINPWDLEPGEKTPGKEKVAFLKNLTRFMIGDSGQSDSELLDNVISEGIHRTYKRVSIRHSNPTPTFSDLRDELAQWRDEEKLQRTIDEAHLAAIKLRSWTGDRGVFAKLFDRHTTARLDKNWLYFNIDGLSNDPRLETAMSLLIANAM
jgi:type IV secretory pathway VirB4 component